MANPERLTEIVCNGSLVDSLSFPEESSVGVDELHNSLCAANMTVLSEQLMESLDVSAVIDEVRLDIRML